MNKYIFLILIFACLPLVDLLSPGLPVTHDGQDHVARIANFYQNLQDGNVIPRWAPNLNWGYGHPVLMFLYPLPSYAASLFHFLGASFVDSVKLVFGISLIVSGLSMYLFMKSIVDRNSALVSAVLYMYAPYRMVDLYVRGAIGEHVAFIFPPLVLYFLYKLSREYRWQYMVGGTLSLGGFILAHNAISLMFLPITLAYAAYLAWGHKKKFVFGVEVLLIFLLGFGVASFFWLPAFFEGKYTLRDIVTSGQYLTRFVNPIDFLYGKWDYGGTGLFTVQVGIVHWLLVLTAILGLIFKKLKNNILIVGLLAVFLFSLFIQISQSIPLWYMFTTLQKFQFPWRFLSVTVFTTAMIGGLVMHSISKKYALYSCALVLIFLFIFTKDYWHAISYSQKPESFYTSIYDGTTDTGESAPIWSIRFMEKRPLTRIEVIGGDAQIQDLQRSSTVHNYLITAKTDAQIKENTIFFPGWHVYVDGKDTPMEYQDQNNRGVITFRVSEGVHKVSVVFLDTGLRRIANYFSIGSLVILGTYSILRARIWRRFRLF